MISLRLLAYLASLRAGMSRKDAKERKEEKVLAYLPAKSVRFTSSPALLLPK